jgi:ubiquinone/menaquinone biosynthesis C-methylase UbiE
LSDQTSNLTKETHWESAAKTRMGKYLTSLETAFIAKAFDPLTSRFVIDIGAEAGRFSLLAANSKVSVVGIDIDAYSLRRLKQKNKDVTVVQADARHIPFKNSSFDEVFMVEVLDYIPQLEETVGDCYRVLKADCPFVLSFGNQSSLKAKLRVLRGKSYTHSYRTVMKSLSKTGFKVTDQLGYSWLPFGRMSQSRFVPLLAGAERIFGLRRLPRFSPWVMLSATKST